MSNRRQSSRPSLTKPVRAAQPIRRRGRIGAGVLCQAEGELLGAAHPGTRVERGQRDHDQVAASGGDIPETWWRAHRLCSRKPALKYGYDVVGVSADSAKSHKGFIEKQSLPFRLIADTDKQLLKAYGAWGEKKMYGKTYEGIIRTTFIISEDGIVEKVIEKVNTKEHAKQILEA